MAAGAFSLTTGLVILFAAECMAFGRLWEMSPAWAIAMFFIPPIVLVAGFKYWDELKGPFLTGLTGLVLVIVGIVHMMG